MSVSLARRTGTVGTLLVAILAVGAAPVLGAAPSDPRPAEAGGAGGREAAPGQQKGASAPVVGPPTGITTGPDTTAAATSSGPVEPAPAPAASKPASKPAADKPAATRPAEAEPPTAKPSAEEPAAKGQGRAEPAAQAPVTAAAGGPPVAAPRSVRPAAGAVAPVARPVPVTAAAPVAAPVMGPHVPWTSRPTALATAGSRSGRARVVAAEPLSLRPRPVGPIALPAVHPQPRPLPVDLGTALPTVAVQTVGAVARTPEWPLGIAVVVLLFLLMQNRIDRRDPKLAQARLEDEAPLEFAPLAV